MISPAQCRAARALLQMKQSDLIRLSGIGISALGNFEAGRNILPESVQALQRALEKAGVEFIDKDGVRRR